MNCSNIGKVIIEANSHFYKRTSMDVSELSKMGRRRFVSALTSIGLSIETIEALSKDDLQNVTSDPSEEVPVLMSQTVKDRGKLRENPTGQTSFETVENYRTVERDEWNRIQGTRNGARKIREKVAQVEGSDAIRVGVTTDHEIRGTQLAIAAERITRVRKGDDEVEITVEEPDISTDQLKEEIPDTITGTVGEPKHGGAEIEDIPVVIREVREIDDISTDCGSKVIGSYYDDAFSPIPAGTQIGADYGGPCTFGFPVTLEPDGVQAFVTNGHCVIDQDGGEDYSDGFDRAVYQPAGGDQAGEVARIKAYFNTTVYPDPMDVAIVELDGNISEYRLADDDGGSEYWLTGRVPWSAMGVLQSSEETVYKQGQTTGRCSGKITSLSEQEDDGTWSMEIDADRDGGDSGGPYFVSDWNGDEEDVLIMGIHRAHNRENGNALGLHSKTIEENFNVDFVWT